MTPGEARLIVKRIWDAPQSEGTISERIASELMRIANAKPTAKIYVQNRGIYGMSVVVARGEDEARRAMLDEMCAYEAGVPIEEHEIEDGLFLFNLGDR